MEEKTKKKKTYKKRRGIENRKKVIQSRCTESEFEKLKKVAKSYGGLSNYVHLMVFSPKKTIIEPKSFLQGMNELTLSINKVGNNINQLAKHVNIASKSGIVDYSIIERCREEITNYVQVLASVKDEIRKMYLET